MGKGGRGTNMKRHDRCIDNSKVGGPVDDEVGVDNAAVILGLHRAGSERVVLGAR
jgi:hypothetical protein